MIEATKNVNQTIKHLKLNLHNEQLLNADNLQLTQVRPTVLNDLNSYNYYLLFLSFFSNYSLFPLGGDGGRGRGMCKVTFTKS